MRKAIKSLGRPSYRHLVEGFPDFVDDTVYIHTDGIERFARVDEQRYDSINVHEHKMQVQRPIVPHIVGSHVPNTVSGKDGSQKLIPHLTSKLLLPNRIRQLYTDMTEKTL